ncbi:MAG: dihydrofolate reductase [Clostridiales bacterium]|nr:dihydrofolate reductase [Clostridiales bacterium]
MNLIVVVDKNWGIGKNNNLLFRLKKDMAFFKQTTTGKVVVMGANTFSSFPHGALPNRVNIVLDDSGREHDGAITVSNITQLDEALLKYDSEDIFVIGGATFYALMLDRCKYAFVTKVGADGEAEVFFPNLDEKKNWRLIEQSDPIPDGEYEIKFCKYVNMNI